jgi:hypothetical protein
MPSPPRGTWSIPLAVTPAGDTVALTTSVTYNFAAEPDVWGETGANATQASNLTINGHPVPGTGNLGDTAAAALAALWGDLGWGNADQSLSQIFRTFGGGAVLGFDLWVLCKLRNCRNLKRGLRRTRKANNQNKYLMSLLKNFDLSSPGAGVGHPNLISQARCISALYEANFQKMKNKEFWKIVVECVKEVKRVEPINLIGVCAIEIKADRDIFFSAG